jgi:hypothetical protein
MKKVILSLVVMFSLSAGILAFSENAPVSTELESTDVKSTEYLESTNTEVSSAQQKGMTNYTISGKYWTKTPTVNGSYVVSVVNTGDYSFSMSVNGVTHTIAKNGNKVFQGSNSGDLYLHAWSDNSMSGAVAMSVF